MSSLRRRSPEQIEAVGEDELQMLERPIFIVGTMRSGSTLFRLILDAHPNIAIGEETGFMGALVATRRIPNWPHGRCWFECIGWNGTGVRRTAPRVLRRPLRAACAVAGKAAVGRQDTLPLAAHPPDGGDLSRCLVRRHRAESRGSRALAPAHVPLCDGRCGDALCHREQGDPAARHRTRRPTVRAGALRGPGAVP